MPRIVDHDQYRRLLLEQCGQLFKDHGYAGLSMRQLAEHLQVSTGTLYHYFKNKEELFRALVYHVADQDLAKIHEALLPLPVEQRLEAFLKLAELSEDDWRCQLLVVCDYARAVGFATFDQEVVLREASQRYLETLEVLLQRSREQVELIEHFLSGLLLNRRLYGMSPDLAKQTAQFLKLLSSHKQSSPP
ncbi:MAG: TetR/AcrR family transcriptional regulator [Myxococcota bacterium]